MIKGKPVTLKIYIFWLLGPILSKAFFAKCTMEMKIPKYHILETPQIIGFFIFYCYYYLFFSFLIVTVLYDTSNISHVHEYTLSGF